VAHLKPSLTWGAVIQCELRELVVKTATINSALALSLAGSTNTADLAQAGPRLLVRLPPRSNLSGWLESIPSELPRLPDQAEACDTDICSRNAFSHRAWLSRNLLSGLPLGLHLLHHRDGHSALCGYSRLDSRTRWRGAWTECESLVPVHSSELIPQV
jgi:hypothetical protein